MTAPHKIWPKSLEPQLNAGQAGDFWGLDGYRCRGPADRMKARRAPEVRQAHATSRGRPSWRNRPAQWNDYEIAADGGTGDLEDQRARS